MSKIGILGYGEIGRAIAGLNSNYKVVVKDSNTDLNKHDDMVDIMVLNICIPYSDEFGSAVHFYIHKYRPELTIIHSTVKPCTTEKLQLAAPDGCYVVHSPIRGKHPDLLEDIKSFTKYVGSDTATGLGLAYSYLIDIGIKNVKLFKASRITELGKLLSTTYYGLTIAWHGEMAAMCEQYDVPFESAVTDFNLSYNDGYSANGGARFTRPVLTPPDKEIGGHCVIPNAKLLSEDIQSMALELILQYSKQEA